MIKRTNRLPREINISPTVGINREADFKRHVVVYWTIEDIPWIEDESEAFDGDVKALTEAVELGLNRRGERTEKIPFKSEKWRIEETTFNFKGLPVGLETKARKFVLHEIIDRNWKSYETIKGHLSKIRRIFTMYETEHPDYIFNYIHSNDVRRFFEESKLGSSAMAGMIYSLILFFQFIKKNYKKEYFSMDIKDLAELRLEVLATAKSITKKKEYPTIPDKLFYEIHFKCMELIRNPKTPFNEKVVACMIILFMWTGLRPKEVRILRRRCLVERREENTVLQFYEYRSPKNKGKVSPCLLFPAAKEALHVLEGLQIRHEVVNKTDYLISFWDNLENKPETSDSIRNAYNSFCLKHFRDICSEPYEGMTKVEGGGRIIFRPSFYCYRVHLCTYLIDHGYDDRWVEGHLGHISPMIRGKYYRMHESTRKTMRSEVKAHFPIMVDTLTALTKQLTRTDESSEQRNERSINNPIIQNLIDNLNNKIRYGRET